MAVSTETIGTETIAGSHGNWGYPTVVITSPSSQVASSPVTVTWTYTDADSLPQNTYRVVLKFASGITAYDSGIVTSTDVTLSIPIVLQDLSQYTVFVDVTNTRGAASATASKVFTALFLGVEDLGSAANIGLVYEVGINGAGYMLADRTSIAPELTYQRSARSLTPPRFATSETPFSEAVERYSFTAATEFGGGAGQVSLDHTTSDPRQYLDSEGIDPFGEQGTDGLRLLKDCAVDVAETYATALGPVTASGKLYFISGTGELTHISAIGGADTQLTLTSGSGATGTLTDIASDGGFWYVTNGTVIVRGTTADPAATWSSVAANKIGWAGQRLCVSYTHSTTGADIFATLSDAGVNESGVGTDDGRLTLPVGWTITDFTGGSGQVFFSAKNGDQGVIYSWTVGSTNAPTVAMELPAGDIPVSIFWYQGQVMMTADRNGTSVIYRCVLSGSTLVPFVAVENAGTIGANCGFTADLSKVYFSWAEMKTGEGGVGALDLATGGYAKWVSATGTGAVGTPTIFEDRIVYLIAGTGLMAEATTYLASGWLTTSISDARSGLEKIYEELLVAAQPIQSGQTISTTYSVDRGGTYLALANDLDTVGATKQVEDVSRRAASMGLKFTLTSDGTSTPVMYLAQIKFAALTLADVNVVLPIDCRDEVRGLNKALLPYKAGDGVRRHRALEQLCQTRVTLQDLGYLDTGLTEVFIVDSVETIGFPIVNPRRGEQEVGLIAVVTLKRAL